MWLAPSSCTGVCLVAYCASSQVTMFEISIFHRRVKRASNVKRTGATKGSISSHVESADLAWNLSECCPLDHIDDSTGSLTCCFVFSSTSTGRAVPLVLVEATFLFLRSSDCEAPVVKAWSLESMFAVSSARGGAGCNISRGNADLEIR